MGGILRFFVILAVLIPASELLAAVYGLDNRREVYQLDSGKREIAEAVALVVPKIFLDDENDELFHTEYDSREYQKELNLCPKEKFLPQPSFGICTAFLIAKDKVLTAGHCFLPKGVVQDDEEHPFCASFSFWFGYHYKKSPSKSPKLGKKIDKKKVYNCRRVIYAQNNEVLRLGEEPVDFAILQLSEEVKDIEPIPIKEKKAFLRAYRSIP